MHLDVFLPDAAISGAETGHTDGLKVLWLLHPESGDCSDWIRLAMVENYAQDANIALVMPNMDNSMYMDMAHGAYPYFTYLTQELPPHLRNLVQLLSHRKEDNFVAGISTGGYGAVKWMLRHPEMFAGGACLSGDVDMAAALRHEEKTGSLARDRIIAFGCAEQIAGSADDIMHLSRQPDAAQASSIHITNSMHDECISRNRLATAALRENGLNVNLHEDPESEGWPFWNEQIRRFIETTVKSSA
jgi:S-formylglutathione hydrolase FrmB